jgi:CRP-like cAMP-binding protein
MSLLDGAGRSASVTALDNTECLRMGHAAFDEAMRTIPLLAYNFARILAARIRLANEHTQALAALDVEHRVARQITAFANRYGQRQADGSVHIPIRLTQSDLSSMIGA